MQKWQLLCKHAFLYKDGGSISFQQRDGSDANHPRRTYSIMADQNSCTINEYCRTQVFNFPRVTFRPRGEVPHMTLYSSPSVKAHVTSNLVDYFENSSSTKHYGIDRSLRHVVDKTYEEIKAQRVKVKDKPVFIVVEEIKRIPEVEVNVECSIEDEILVLDGEKVSVREGKTFKETWHTSDGDCIKLLNNQQVVALILTAVWARQDTSQHIRNYLDVDCLVTNDGRCVKMRYSPPLYPIGPHTVKDVDTPDIESLVSEIAKTIESESSKKADKNITTQCSVQMVNLMYKGERKIDHYHREILKCLRIWQNIIERTIQGRLRDALLLSLYRYIACIAHEEYDHKIVDLCTALESVLTTKNDPRKGEAIALRRMLLSMALGKKVPHPTKLYELYEKRSDVVHGSKLGECGEGDYRTLRTITETVILAILDLQGKNPNITRPSYLIEHLESPDRLEKAYFWLKCRPGRGTKAIAEYAKKRLSEGNPTGGC